MSILEADNMWLEYNGNKILQSIYIKVETGQVIGLLGRNGTGKTSLLRMIFGTLRAQNQSVRINKTYVSHPYLEKNLIRYLPQTSFIPPNLKIDSLCDIYDVSFLIITKHLPELKEYKGERIGNLSGGKVRLMETLLILLSPVSFALLDEPFTHLDPVITEKLLMVISEQKRQKGIIMSDHSYANVLFASDDIYI